VSTAGLFYYHYDLHITPAPNDLRSALPDLCLLCDTLTHSDGFEVTLGHPIDSGDSSVSLLQTSLTFMVQVINGRWDRGRWFRLLVTDEEPMGDNDMNAVIDLNDPNDSWDVFDGGGLLNGPDGKRMYKTVKILIILNEINI
jgi:hypothetical protein